MSHELSFSEAFKAAGPHVADFDYCAEYPDAYVFSKLDNMSFGGFDSPHVVLKRGGRLMSMAEYIGIRQSGEPIREGFIRDWEKEQ